MAADELRLWWCPETDNDQPRRNHIDTLLRTVLAPVASVTPAALVFSRESKGRPYLALPGAPDFNLSDTRGGSLVAMTHRGRVGVDLERLDRELPVARLAHRWFSAEETVALTAMPAADMGAAFLRLWTAKEASCKATGTGIYGFLPQWVFDPIHEQPGLRRLPESAGAFERWRFIRLRPSSKHTAVLALRDLSHWSLTCYTLQQD